MKKRMLIAMMTIITVAALAGCSNSGTKKNDAGTNSSSSQAEDSAKVNVSTESIVNSIKSQIQIRATALVEGDLLTEKFHLNMDIIEEETIENGMMNTGLETIAVVKAKSGQVDAVKEAFEKVKEDKKSSAFYPGEAEAVDSAVIRVVGDYVGLFIIPDYDETGENYSEKAADIFEEALK